MFLYIFQDNPSAGVAFLLGLVIGITVHEAAHATSAYLLGDDTAYRDGRVTLEEVRPALDAQFRALDANRDNGVTLDELPLPPRGGGEPIWSS